MSEILFIRHAETDMAGTFCGHSDPDLNARGRIQVGELIDQLRIGRTSAWCTPATCDGLTNRVGACRSVPCRMSCTPALREIDFGRWEGHSWKEIERAGCRPMRADGLQNIPICRHQTARASIPLNVACWRRSSFLVEKTEDTDSSIAVVTHAGVLRSVLRTLHGCSEEEAGSRRRSYCSLVRYQPPYPC